VIYCPPRGGRWPILVSNNVIQAIFTAIFVVIEATASCGETFCIPDAGYEGM
jgi:hypothetical protein